MLDSALKTASLPFLSNICFESLIFNKIYIFNDSPKFWPWKILIIGYFEFLRCLLWRLEDIFLEKRFSFLFSVWSWCDHKAQINRKRWSDFDLLKCKTKLVKSAKYLEFLCCYLPKSSICFNFWVGEAILRLLSLILRWGNS